MKSDALNLADSLDNSTVCLNYRSTLEATLFVVISVCKAFAIREAKIIASHIIVPLISKELECPS